MLIQEPTGNDLSKDIKNFEVDLRTEKNNPLDEMANQGGSSSDDTTTNQSQKDENLMKNTKNNYNQDGVTASVNGTTTETNNTNETSTGGGAQTSDGSNTSQGSTTEGSTDTYEEKTKYFHSIPENIQPTTTTEKTTSSSADISSFYSILFVGVLCTLALLIIALRNFSQKYFEIYILATLRYILM